ncbi:MAG: magnesium-translocating P-type ATPase, partial [Acholeplasmataceae bacterium]|nr:magnesium-translocating P-type ATPase [Acholeplasmataceae bacterium]
VIEGRKTFGNIMKYIKMATSGNFGNMIAVIIASIFLPFLPMLPVHILTQNLLNDFSQVGMAFDDVDKEYLYRPQKWNSKGVLRFTFIMGPLSSIFDILCFIILWWLIGANTIELAPLFQAGWFVFGTVSQVLVIYVIRTQKLAIIKSRPAKPLFISTIIIAAIAIIIGFTKAGMGIDLAVLPVKFLLWLTLLSITYLVSAELVKKLYIRKFGEWI